MTPNIFIGLPRSNEKITDRNIEQSVKAYGGYARWREECILENLTGKQWREIASTKRRISRLHRIISGRPAPCQLQAYERQIFENFIDAPLTVLYELLPGRTKQTISVIRSRMAACRGYVFTNGSWVCTKN